MTASADFEELGRVLRQARQHSRMSQRETAEAANISATYVRALEAAANPNTKKPSQPSPAVLQAMGKVLRLDAEDLLRLAGHDPEAIRKAEGQGAADTTGGSVERDLRTMKDAAKKLQLRHPFIHAQAVERVEKFTTEFMALVEGTFRCTAEEEPFLTRLAYRQARSRIQAVSYQDEKWWMSKHGREYLRLNAEVHDKGIKVTRIFLIPEEHQPAMREIFERHVEIGIPAFVMSPEEAGEVLCREFVIFDDGLLRTGELPDSRGFRKAEFTDNPAFIAQASGEFRALYRIARNTPTEAEYILEEMS